MTMRAVLGPLLLLSVLLATAQAGAAQGEAGEQAPSPEHRAVVLVHHPLDSVDPFGVAFGTRDTFAGRYATFADAAGTFPYPTFVADGVVAVLALPNPDVPYQGTIDNYTRTIDARLDAPAPLSITLSAVASGPAAQIHVGLSPVSSITDPSGTSDLRLWLALTEDQIYFTDEAPVWNGVEIHRFTVRALHDAGPVDFASGAAVARDVALPLDADWQTDRVSVAAWVQAGPAGGRFVGNEVLQAASTPLGGPVVVQEQKAVLAEMYSATWCKPCLYGDLALEQVAIRYAGAAPAEVESGPRYFEAPGSYTGVGARLLDTDAPIAVMDAVLLVGALSAAVALAVSAWDVARRPARPSPAGLAAFSFAALCTFGACAFLASRFLATDLSYQYVFFYTRSDLEWQWRLAGTWAGREGSLLLWTLCMAGVSAVLAWTHRRGTGNEALDRARSWTRLFMAGGLVLFMLASFQDSPFAPTSDNLLQGRPEGNGLNPTLKSAFILIHPPLMFLAYALSAIPAAAVLGHLASGTNQWSRVALTWARSGWIVMTFALGLGAMWAYFTLGFGGYFAWDPVEVANLLPWLAFTVYLHAQLHHLRHGAYALLGPLLGILPFLLTVFSTISTRSGLWVSVHAFTDPTDTFNPDAAGRFLDILRVEDSLGFYVGLFLASFALFAAMWAYRLWRDGWKSRALALAVAAPLGVFAVAALAAPLTTFSALLEASYRIVGSAGFGLLAAVVAVLGLAAAPALFAAPPTDQRPARGLQKINLRTLNAYAVAVLGLALLVLFLFHMAATNGWSTAFYEARFPYLATPVILGLLVFQGHQAYGRRRSLWIAAGVAAAGIAARFLVPAHGGGAMLATLAAGLVVVSLDRIRRAGAAPGIGRKGRIADLLLWLAAILDVLFWAAPPALRFGVATVHVPFLATLPVIALALLGLWGATRILAGAPPRRPVWCYALVGLLAGFYVALPMAALAWWQRGRNLESARLDNKSLARLRQVGLYGIHMAMAVALVGYATSTYFTDKADTEVAIGESVLVGGQTVTYEGTPTGPPSLTPLDALAPHFSVSDSGRPIGAVDGSLQWETAAAAHYPLPATLHRWNSDLYLDVEAVHVAPGGSCLAPSDTDGAWIEAYRATASGRVCGGDTIDLVRFKAVDLPGIGLLWLALLLLVFHMALILFAEPRDKVAAPDKTSPRLD